MMRSWIMKKFYVKSDQIKVLYDRPSDNYFIFSDKDRLSVIVTYVS